MIISRSSAPRPPNCSPPPARSGRRLPSRPKDEQAACRSFGMNLGIAFQLVDDALDYGGKAAKLGKNVGDDFREGKITLPVVLSFRRGSETRTGVLAAHAGGRRDRPMPISSMRSALMTKHRALDDTIQRARHYGAIATDALALFPGSAMKEALEEAVEFCICRSQLTRLSCQFRRPHPPSRMRRPQGARPLPPPRAACRTAQSRSHPSPTCARAGSPADRRAPPRTSPITGCNRNRRHLEVVAFTRYCREKCGALPCLRSLGQAGLHIVLRKSSGQTWASSCANRAGQTWASSCAVGQARLGLHPAQVGQARLGFILRKSGRPDLGFILRKSGRPDLRCPEQAEHVPGRNRHPRIDQDRCQPRDIERIGKNVADARASAADADRDTPAHRRRSPAPPA